MLFGGSKENQFFRLLSSAASVLSETAAQFGRLAEQPELVAELSPKIKALEKQGDDITHEIISLLNRLFITPLEREDILSLAVRLDDVTDGLEAAAARIHLFKLRTRNQFFVDFAKLIQAQAAEIVAATQRLESKNLQPIRQHAMQINVLENEADQLLRRSLEALFDEQSDAVMIIKLKEIYETLESVTDRAEDVANALESVVMKNS
ncbi:MAG TPA: DUF47 family protein [Symbiobacteriaceae bacterium]|nr:DUF47 family protein [Symbiobacteriaceae bacterium]